LLYHFCLHQKEHIHRPEHHILSRSSSSLDWIACRPCFCHYIQWKYTSLTCLQVIFWLHLEHEHIQQIQKLSKAAHLSSLHTMLHEAYNLSSILLVICWLNRRHKTLPMPKLFL
jgi:hypothetical protein